MITPLLLYSGYGAQFVELLSSFMQEICTLDMQLIFYLLVFQVFVDVVIWKKVK